MEEVNKREAAIWIKEFWPDGDFELLDIPVDRGSYSVYCCVAQRGNELFFLKRYNLVLLDGAIAEIDNYDRYGDHPILPPLTAKLPVGAEHKNTAYEAIIIPYYEHELKPRFLLEVLAICLNLATIFKYFAQDSLIYFDLRPDSLRLNNCGALQLIDLTDLISPSELYFRGRGLPVVDRTSQMVPPEGQRYQKAYDYFSQTLLKWNQVRQSALKLSPEAYHTYSLGRLMLIMLGWRTLRDKKVRDVMAMSKSPAQGGFDMAEEFLSLLKNMLGRQPSNRTSLDEVRIKLWRLLKPYIVKDFDQPLPSVAAARARLRTLTREESDDLSLEIHENLNEHWRGNSK
jgi:hypothetical protein